MREVAGVLSLALGICVYQQTECVSAIHENCVVIRSNSHSWFKNKAEFSDEECCFEIFEDSIRFQITDRKKRM